MSATTTNSRIRARLGDLVDSSAAVSTNTQEAVALANDAADTLSLTGVAVGTGIERLACVASFLKLRSAADEGSGKAARGLPTYLSSPRTGRRPVIYLPTQRRYISVGTVSYTEQSERSVYQMRKVNKRKHKRVYKQRVHEQSPEPSMTPTNKQTRVSKHALFVNSRPPPVGSLRP